MQISINKLLQLSAIALVCAIVATAAGTGAAVFTTTLTPTSNSFREVPTVSGAHSSPTTATSSAQTSSSSSFTNNDQMREDKQRYSSIGSTTAAISSPASSSVLATATSLAAPQAPLTVSSGPSPSSAAPAQISQQQQQHQYQYQQNHHPHQQRYLVHHQHNQVGASNVEQEESAANSNNRRFEETNYKLLHNNNHKKQQLQLLQQEQSLPSTPAVTKAQQSDLCQIKNGESVAIVEIEETRNGDNSFSLQTTTPRELPIIGSVADGEIELKIESETHKYFQLNGKKLELIKPLNRDPILREAAISSVYIQLSCSIISLTKSNETAGSQNNNSKVIVPILVKVIDINDNAPRFSAPKFAVQVNELAPVGTIILGSDQLRALDLDSANNGLVEYTLQGSNVETAKSTPSKPQSTSTTATSSTITTSSPVIIQSSLSSVAPIAISTNALKSQSTKLHQNQQQPTININNEPIQNGPMDDSDEESDESLLASLANSTTQLTGAAGNSAGGSSNSELFGLPQPPELPEMPESPELSGSINASVGNQNQPDSGDALSEFVVASRKRSTKRKRRHDRSLTKRAAVIFGEIHSRLKQQPQKVKSQLPWTNLMEPLGLTIDDQQTMAQSQDSLNFFGLEMSASGPQIRLKKPLDFETRPVHQLTIVATDKATNKTERLSSWAQIVIRVTDGDDQGPAFLLEQSGCATPSASASAATTTMSPSMTARYSTLSSGDQLNSIDRMQAAASLQTHSSRPLHNGFRVISDQSDDFDFGDSADSLSNRNLHQNQQIIKSQASSTTVAADGAANVVDYFSCLGPSTSLLGSGGIAEYWASVMAGDSDQLVRILPQSIKARDRDLLNAPIHYSFVNGTPENYSHYFQINPLDGFVKQIAPIDRLSSLPDRFVILLEAQEQTLKRHSSQARLTIEVKPSDWSPPTLEANFQSGSVNENAPVGTLVKQSPDSPPMRVRLVPKSASSMSQHGYISWPQPSLKGVYEYETTSDLFKVDKDGFVYVAAANLDADLPSSPVYMFQVTAKLMGHTVRNHNNVNQDASTAESHPLIVGAATSSQGQALTLVTTPISLNVTLLDVDDNGPQISSHASSSSSSNSSNNNNSSESKHHQVSFLEPIQIVATSVASSSRHLLTLHASDKDLLAENRQHKFSLLHVSQGARDRFKLDELSGDLRAIGKFSIGEQFSLTVQVADSQQRQSQSILEVQVIAGPNLSAPQFVVHPTTTHQATLINQNQQISARSSSQNLATAASQLQQQQLAIGDFQVEITEALAPHSPVFQLHAQDPENEPITFSIVGGNVNQDFYINPNSGLIQVQNKLDREEVSQYNLLVQARDPGGLSTVRGLRVKILDTNDENPIFQQDQYEFSVAENQPVGTILGRVRANDADSGDFGKVSYHLESNSMDSKKSSSPSPFAINETTGEVRLLEKLDYEQTRAYSLIVRAKDQDKRPRSTICKVMIQVLDVQDELPYFEPSKQSISVQLWESQQVGKPLENVSVMAIDPDSIQQITYELKWASASNLFDVNPKTGQIELLQQLDFEQAREFTLLIGTRESPVNDSGISQYLASMQADLSEKSPVCKIDIKILDLNDNAPQFEPASLMPIRVKSSIQLGSQIGQLIAHDADGSKPNNQFRYELAKSSESPINSNNESLSNYCGDYFMLDASTGQLFVKLDLRRLSDSECQLVVVANDLGFMPMSLSSRASLTIYIDHIAEQPTGASLLAFADTNFYAEIRENSMPGVVVKVLPIVNKLRKLTHTFPYSCRIIDGNDEAKFEIGENQFGDCEIRLRDQKLLDFEKTSRYVLSVRLNSLASGASATHSLAQQQSSIAELIINVLDRNDNKPAIELPARYADLTQGKYLAVVSADSPPETQVTQIKATDLDSSRSGNGLISYEFIASGDSPYAGYFSIDSASGVVRTNRPLDDIDDMSQPIKLVVRARDNPADENERVYETTVEAFVNLLTIRHRLALSFPRLQTVNFSKQVKNDLLSVVQERSGFISGLERIESLKVTKRKSSTSPSSLHQLSLIESDVNGTDFWFYLIEPGTFKLVLNDDLRVTQSLFEDRAQKSLRDIIQQRLSSLFGVDHPIDMRLRLPYQTITYDGNPINPSSSSPGLLSFSGLAGGFKWLFGPASAVTSAAITNLSDASINKTLATEASPPAPKSATQVRSPNYATRVLSSLHQHYSKVAGDQYAGLLISLGILISISSIMMLVCQCKAMRESSSRSSRKSSSSTCSRSSRSQLNQLNKPSRGLTKKQSRKLSKQGKKHKGQARIDVSKDPQAAILQAQMLQHQQQQQLNPLSPNSYFLQLDQQQQQQETLNAAGNAGNTFESFAAANGHQIYGSSFSTANSLNSMKPNAIEQLYAPNGATGETLARISKQYETQMHKMSVIYDDNFSVDGHQLRK